MVSSTLGDPEWQNSTVLGADWLDRVRALKAEDGGDIVVTGSLTLCPTLIEAGLVDEYRLFVYPAVQGGGRRLFPEGREESLVLKESKTFANGVVLLVYTPALEKPPHRVVRVGITAAQSSRPVCTRSGQRKVIWPAVT